MIKSKRGAKTYNTGKPCKHGHSGERYISSRNCVTCVCERSRERFLAHPESVREESRCYYAANTERRKAKYRQYHAANRERQLERMKRYDASRRAQRASMQSN